MSACSRRHQPSQFCKAVGPSRPHLILNMKRSPVIRKTNRQRSTAGRRYLDSGDRMRVISIDQITCNIAGSRSEYEVAFELLHRRYLDAGLTTDCDRRLRVLPYHLAPSTQVFVAKQRGQELGCVSLVRDACSGGLSGGLPMDQWFASKLEY